MVQPFPAPSLRELARPQGVTEGVSSDGCSTPMNCEPAHIGSEIFERLRSSGYTPSVSLSLDSSLREGAGRGAYHSTCRSETGRGRAIFIAPTKAQKFLHFTIQRAGGGCIINTSSMVSLYGQPHGQLRYRRNNQRRRRCPNLNLFSPHPFCPLPFPGFRRRKGNFFWKTL